MSDNKQHQHNDQLTEHEKEPTPGILITRVRGYNLFNTVFFTGRRYHLDSALAAVTKATPGEHVLDIGCGPGRFAGVLADRVGLSGTVVGVDPSGPMVDYASAHAGRRSNCDFRRGAAQSLSLPDSSFDVVTATFVMHHIFEDQREVALATMFRTLRPGRNHIGSLRGIGFDAIEFRAIKPSTGTLLAVKPD